MAAALARPAAAVSPKMVGSPRGLRVTPCNIAPATPRDCADEDGIEEAGEANLADDEPREGVGVG